MRNDERFDVTPSRDVKPHPAALDSIFKPGLEDELHSNVIIQKTPAEILRAAFDRNLILEVIPGLEEVVSKNDSQARWNFKQTENQSVKCSLILKRDASTFLEWELSHPNGVLTGRIHLTELPANRGTLVSLTSNTREKTDSLIELVKKIFTNKDDYTLGNGLKRFKALLESGQIPTTFGQPHGNKGKGK